MHLWLAERNMGGMRCESYFLYTIKLQGMWILLFMENEIAQL